MSAEEKTSVSKTLLHTPLGDVARGRASGSLDWRRAVADADLPSPIPDVLTETIRRTRLKRREKAEIARELTDHFRDGLDAGADAATLTSRFGSPQVAARLLRRAAVRKRSVLWHARAWAARGIGAMVALLIVAYIASAAHFHIAQPTIAVNYIDRLNAGLAEIPDASRAWPTYREAYLAVPIGDRETLADYSDARPGDPAWAEVAPILERHAGVIDRVASATSLPALGFRYGQKPDVDIALHHGNMTPPVERATREQAASWPADTSELWLISVRLDAIVPIRAHARMLALDGRRAAAAGDGGTTAERVHQLLRLAEHANDGRLLISQLVSIAIMELARDLAASVLNEAPELWNDAQLTTVAHALAGFGGGRLSPSFESERWMFYDVMQRTYSDNGSGNGRLVRAGFGDLVGFVAMEDVRIANEAYPLELLAGPVMARVGADRRTLVRMYDGIVGEAERAAVFLPFERNRDALDEKFAALDTAEASLRYHPVTVLVPALGSVLESFDMANLRRDGTLTAIALEAHKRRAGAYPASLDEVSTRALPRVPIDPFDGQPLRYELRDGSPLVYSVGADAADHGGAAAEPRRRGMIRRLPGADDAGDVVLWPPATHEPVELDDGEL